MDDLIKREDAIKAVRESKPWHFNEIVPVLSAIKGIPSAEKHGKWIHNPNGIDRDFIWWKCSECGQVIFSETEKDRREFHAFCGRCGADMREEDDERQTT